MFLVGFSVVLRKFVVMKFCGQMFAEQSEYMQTEQFHNLLYTVYKIAMDHYPDGPQSCRQLFKTLHAVVDSAVSSNYNC